MTEEEFDELRRSAFAIAYRMLGSASEAEDLVQEGLLRLHRAREGGERIESPRAYLSTVVSRLALDHLRSAVVRRESYVGEWLPEPLVTSADDDPARKAEMADSLSLAFLVLLESLSPEQRAAFLLREVFDEPYDRIAEIVGTSEQNARQLATRARRHVDERRRGGWVRFEASREQQEELATRFFAAAEEGDLQGLEELLAHDVVFRGDGGGKAPAAAHAVHGRASVARLLIAGLRALARFGGLHHAPRGGQRATRCAVLRPRGQGGQRGDPRHRGGPDPGRERDRQPGQAAPPWAGGRPARPPARAPPLSATDRRRGASAHAGRRP
jgi:RNA polymerase sigma factor (sigma-70 family)